MVPCGNTSAPAARPRPSLTPAGRFPDRATLFRWEWFRWEYKEAPSATQLGADGAF